MPQSRRAASRLLTPDESDLVSRTEAAAMRDAEPADLADLRRTLRDRRDRARDISRQQRREMRGKTEPRGARPAGDNTGSIGKKDLLTAALKRVGNELRRRLAPKRSQSDFARKALALKSAAGRTSTKPEDNTANDGMQNLPHQGQAPSGALDHAGAEPALHRAKFAR